MRSLLAAACALLIVAAQHGEPASHGPTTLHRRFTPQDRVAGRYQYVPVEVPAGTATLRISYSYDRAGGANVIDLGLFEPGPLDLGTTAFRGYSGGSKSSIVLGPDETSPGYRPGPLPAGTWHVLLGLYQVAAAGVDVTVAVETLAGSPARAVPHVVMPRPPASDPGPRWYMGALHAHTIHSDGAVSPRDLLSRAAGAGLDFIAVTDHNHTLAGYELRPQVADGSRPLWIVGEEVTTPAGHANVWGLQTGDWVDFRVPRGDARIAALVDAVRRRGALFSINHPVSDCAGCSWEHDIPPGVNAIEVWNGSHGAQDRAIALWDSLLRSGRKVTGVGASDWHRDPAPIDAANVRVFAASLDTAAVLDALRAGRVIAMKSAREATPEISVSGGGTRAGVGDTLQVRRGEPITLEVAAPGLGGGRLIVVTNGEHSAPVTLDAEGRGRVRRAAEPGYVRVELYAADGALVALANPVFVMMER